MSRADAILIDIRIDILDHGVGDTDQTVRPRWEDGTARPHCQTVRHRQPL